MLTKDDLTQIANIVKAETEPLKQGQKRLEQGQAQTNTTLAQIKTTVETLEAGQKDMRENMATKADIHRLEQKIDKVAKRVKSGESRIDNLEEHTNIPNPHKN